MRRLPTNVLELRGAYKKNPQRRAAPAPSGPPAPGGTPAPGGLPDLEPIPPDHMGWESALCYAELVRAAPPGALKTSDAFVVEMAAVLLTRFRADGAFMEPALLNRLFVILRALGLTPTGRGEVMRGLPVAPRANAFRGLLSRG